MNISEIITKYWLEFLLISLTTSLSCVIKQYGGIKKGMISLLKNEIIRTYEKYTNDDYSEFTMIICLDKVNKEFIKYIDSEITQTTNRRILPVGIVFENKTMYVANQNSPIYKKVEKNLQKRL